MQLSGGQQKLVALARALMPGNKALKSKLTCFITITAMNVAPDNNITALMICTQVVEAMPPQRISCVEDVLEVDRRARELAKSLL